MALPTSTGLDERHRRDLDEIVQRLWWARIAPGDRSRKRQEPLDELLARVPIAALAPLKQDPLTPITCDSNVRGVRRLGFEHGPRLSRELPIEWMRTMRHRERVALRRAPPAKSSSSTSTAFPSQ